MANLSNALRRMNEGLVVRVRELLHLLLDAQTLISSNLRLLVQSLDTERRELTEILLFLGLEFISRLGIAVQQPNQPSQTRVQQDLVANTRSIADDTY